MAFNFNWSPLTADADFYQRARDLLTTALNKSPKPPIIVDDIFVTEFNLGSVPPELEILEIGDLAEDRFRGIFKMCYSGDAYLTLRTRVQANPLNTYLSAKPTFTSPQPLAAAAGLTIPLSITLSEIKLSAFVILVFSKKKGLTLVFRNDPLESIKVSSTFDSIQFVRDYLQRTIEGQLRNLMMDELPAIIHKLSLQLWCPDQLPREEQPPIYTDEDVAVDPLAFAPSNAVDANGQAVDPQEGSLSSMEAGSEMYNPLFSQGNLMGVNSLHELHRSLSLYSPGIRDTLFRVWSGPTDRADTGRATPLVSSNLMRTTQNAQGTSTTTYTFADTEGSVTGSTISRPSLASQTSVTTGLALGAGRSTRMSRKKKTRVVNLRKPKSQNGSEATTEPANETGELITESESCAIAGSSSEPAIPSSISEEPEADPPHPNDGTSSRVRFEPMAEREHHQRPALTKETFMEPSVAANMTVPSKEYEAGHPLELPEIVQEVPTSSSSNRPFSLGHKRGHGSESSSAILEQVWISKMAGEIARRVYDEKHRHANFWADRDDTPPPAYDATL